MIAALIKDSTTRKLLFDDTFEFIAPEFIEIEIRKYANVIMKKADICERDFEILLSLIFEQITILPISNYERQMDELKQEISDWKDLPYLACALSENAEAVWSHDPHFLEQNKIRVFTNIDLLKLGNDSESR